MTAQGEDILAWLETVITAREEAARAVGWDTIETVDYLWSTKHLLLKRADESLATTELDADLAAHIALNDPESVLRRCAADRKLLKLHRPVVLRAGGGARHFETTTVCTSCEPPRQFPETARPCPSLLAIAEGYGWTGGDR